MPLTNTEERLGDLTAFAELPDPRSRRCRYPLQELLLVAFAGVASGAQDWVGVTDWGQIKLDWLRRYLPFEHGIASHDTFNRVFALLDAQAFEACFIRWMQPLCPPVAGATIAIDGKSARGSRMGGAAMVHLVSACDPASGLTLGQSRTEAKSNEMQQHITIDKGHSRLETRRCVVAHDVSTLSETIRQDWPGLRTAIMIESTREFINGRSKGESSTERRY